LARRGALEPPGRDGPRHRMHRWAPQIVGPEGDSYVLLPMPAGEPPFAVLGTHDVWLGLLVLALASSGVVAWWLARYVSRPVTRLQQSARALASGNLDARVGTAFTRRRDELGVLARDFDRMAEQLRELIALKETLLRDISHELRSPLARMRVALGLARRPGAAVDRELDRIEREAERLDELIAQILRVSRLASTDPGLRQEPCDLGALVSAVVDDVRLEAVAGERQIDWQTPDGILVDGDADLLRSAVENVLRNAVRFTAPGSAVRVFLHQVGDRAVLHIHDAGPGVPEGELERIFEPFYRSGDARDRSSGGTGLGLSITARVLALHGGTARALNAPEGGLIVELELPLVAAAQRGDSAGANRSAAP
ncbi:MAG TPA: ATP-binding protein, partial [Gammaproteobacteria bacterium]|nr:ATP-binding protein [Gammaproteobacteria bacterium]